MNEFEFAEKYINPFLRFILFKVLRLKQHGNNIGVHFYLPINPHHLFSIDLYIGRINLFWPPFCSVSVGLLGHKVFQVYSGIKFDPTETEKLKENDYLLTIASRFMQTGKNCRVNSEASF